MQSLEERMRSNKCLWLGGYLKDKLKEGDLRTYNRIKKVLYYFPSVVSGLSRDNFDMAVKHPDDSYICVSANDYDFRYKGFDELYKKKNGIPFNVEGAFENRYVSLKDIYDYFRV